MSIRTTVYVLLAIAVGAALIALMLQPQGAH
jgi:hypothetical protein